MDYLYFLKSEKDDYLKYFKKIKWVLTKYIDLDGDLFLFLRWNKSQVLSEDFFETIEKLNKNNNKKISLFLMINEKIDFINLENKYFIREYCAFLKNVSDNIWQKIHSWLKKDCINFKIIFNKENILSQSHFILFFHSINSKKDNILINAVYDEKPREKAQVNQKFKFKMSFLNFKKEFVNLSQYVSKIQKDSLCINKYIENESISFLKNIPIPFLREIFINYDLESAGDIFYKINDKIFLKLNLIKEKVNNEFYWKNKKLIHKYVQKEIFRDKFRKVILFKKEFDQNFYKIFGEWKHYNFYITNSLEEYFKNIKFKWQKYLEESSKVKKMLLKDDGEWRKKWQSLDIEKDLSHRKPLELQKKQMLYAEKLAKSLNFSIPGSGKTVIGLLLSHFLKKSQKIKKTFIFAPVPAFESWKNEYCQTFKNKEPKILNLSLISSNKKISQLQYDLEKYNYIIMHYATAAKKYINDELKKNVDSKTLIIIDEAHYIKGNKTWGTNITKLANQAGFALLMTGTPAPNTIKDTYNFLEIILGQNFRIFFSKKSIEKQKALFSNLYFRIDYDDLNLKYKPRQFEVHYSLSQEQVEEINNLRKEAKQFIEDGRQKELFKKESQIQKIRQIYTSLNLYRGQDFTSTTSNKLKRMLKFLEEKKVLKNKLNVLIWCEFRHSVISVEKSIKEYFDNDQIKIYKHFGSTPQDKRVEQIEKYKKYGGILIASLGTLAESVSLHKETNFTIYFEYNFDLIDWLQSKYRTFRYGINFNPEYYILVSKNPHNKTLEEKILKILKSKNSFQKKLLEGRTAEKQIEKEILNWISDS